jgi:hypothetical protein
VKKFVFAGLFLFLWAALALGQMIYVASAPTKFAWDDPNVPAASQYEITLIRDVTKESFKFLTTTPTISISSQQTDTSGKKLKSGVYEVRVKCIVGGQPSVDCSSLDAKCSQLKTGTAGTWKVFYKPAAPLGPIIVQ